MGFEHEREARRFLADLRERFTRFGMELADDKTNLLEFGRFAAARRRRRGLGRPETFAFFGLVHIGGTTRTGRFKLLRITIAKRMRAKLAEVNVGLRRRVHLPIAAQGRWLARMIRGHMAYYAVPDNYRAVNAFRRQATSCGTARCGVAANAPVSTGNA